MIKIAFLYLCVPWPSILPGISPFLRPTQPLMLAVFLADRFLIQKSICLRIVLQTCGAYLKE